MRVAPLPATVLGPTCSAMTTYAPSQAPSDTWTAKLSLEGLGFALLCGAQREAMPTGAFKGWPLGLHEGLVECERLRVDSEGPIEKRKDPLGQRTGSGRAGAICI